MLENDANLMPPKSVCTLCPTQEYKELKKQKEQTTKVMRLKSKNELKLEIKKVDKVQAKIKLIKQKIKEQKGKKNEKKEKKGLKEKSKENNRPSEVIARIKRLATGSAQVVCEEKGNGFWSDPVDCNAFHIEFYSLFDL